MRNQKIQINIQDNVSVKLTQTGINILEAKHQELMQVFPNANVKPYETDADGYVTLPIYMLIAQLGEHITMTANELPIEKEIIIHKPLKE